MLLNNFRKRFTTSFALRITLLYIILGSLWILFSDRILFLMINDKETLAQVSSYKGWLYVLFTGILLYLLIKKEIRKRNMVEKELLAAKLKAEESEMLKTAFLNNISHHIRTPMNAILGFSELIVDPDLSTHEKLKFPDFIRKGVSNLIAIIEDIIIVARLQAGQVHHENDSGGDINQLLHDLRDYFQAQIDTQMPEKKIDVRVESILIQSNTLLQNDFRHLRQVLMRLLNNAVKFTEKGKICLSCSSPAQGELLFKIQDTGCGIPTEKHKIIFEAFRKAEDNYLLKNKDGSGLGLTIAKGLIDLMKGKIWVESIEGKGSTFYFTIPVSE